MPAQAQRVAADWWGDEEPPTAEEAEMVAELLEAHPKLSMVEALKEIRLWSFLREEEVQFAPTNGLSRRGRG